MAIFVNMCYNIYEMTVLPKLLSICTKIEQLTQILQCEHIKFSAAVNIVNGKNIK